MVDYYKVLEISRNSSQTDIKKAYRKLALKWHPDKHVDPQRKDEAERRFKEISRAYDVLSDDDKKRAYDQFDLDSETRNYRSRPFKNDYTFKPTFNTKTSDSFFEDDFFTFKKGFTFREPNDLFKDFFNNDPFKSDFFTKPDFFTRSSLFDEQFDDQFSSGCSSGSSTSSKNSEASDEEYCPNKRRVSSSTRFINGQIIETKCIIENGIKTTTVSVLEDGILKSRSINGIVQPIC